ncbi:MAG TPA: phosphoglycerate kinase [Candidatus Paceibacterota bacterium]
MLTSLPVLSSAPISKGTRVLLRLCMNVPMDGERITDDFRLIKVLPTLKFLLDKGAVVTIISHLGGDGSHSLDPIEKYLREHCPGDYRVLPNLRINPGEKGNDEAFARELAANQDVYVDEDFPAAHREHASIVGVPKLLPSFVGLQFEQEVEHLSRFLNPIEPCVVVLGGAKLATKMPMINAFLPKAEQIFLGSFFATVADDVPKNPKVILPEDVTKVEGVIVDSGPKALAAMIEAVSKAKSVIWNGPIGKFEAGFNQTTNDLAQAIAANTEADTVVGGGDSIAAIEALNIMDKFDFVSTGGGAMLDFLAHGTLPGIDAIINSPFH